MRLLTPLLLKLRIYHPLRRVYHYVRDRGKDSEAIFAGIYLENYWRGSESLSGEGSSIKQTRVISSALPALLGRFEIRVLLDIPCGDFHWMSMANLGNVKYVGGDIVTAVVQRNAVRWGAANREFHQLDLCRDVLPSADLIFCRDCLGHLPYKDIGQAIHNIRRSGARYLLTTTFLELERNHDIALGDFRPINLQRPPFNFPLPLQTILEGCTEKHGAHADKAMALWRVVDIPNFTS